ncbi:MAG: sigma-54-dependent Fis family transcriptional regulator [Deltaproteobacteria bacterium]|nr:sigma-54-dependent Fis family transcriptional regulator [Deltaproteobacteria bacterium]MBW1961283.1 sigma-54-dependent Fis family transcriptional regulator [Deltaproteobacteria bacterium]MBW1995681.1 sigma-54-dependent Fis family transcriptional regulator [Deltaproteobacteria bacterium]MBW2152717.1 sigma-54-dependent Fis family transcriptional regulator [Deltaproteobacteria bacterium]
MKPKILVVDDDLSLRQMLNAVLSDDGYEVQEASDGQSAVEAVENQFYDLILLDIRMARMGGIEALKQIKKLSPGIPVIIMTAYASVDTAREALKSGAFDYLTKPLDIDELKLLLERALRHYQLEQENRYLKERLDDRFDFGHIIGNSAAMRALFETLAQVAPSEATVLITGESGTGKELIANAIHQNSPRKSRPMIKVNCAALPETLLESELFGHEKGAFTGATSRTRGRFQMAHGSTIFLDEIGEMSPATQAKILRALQEKEIEPVGGSATIKIDTRVIAATNKNLEVEIREGRFREDLYYRLNVVTVEVPPLRKRQEDIPLLADFFLKQYAEKNRKHIKGFTPKALDIMMRYDWPGNVRELENLVERSVVLARADMITPDEFPDAIRDLYMETKQQDAGLTPGRTLKDVEREMIIRTLEETGGNRTHAAKILGISRRTLQLKLKEYGIN